MLKIKDNIDLKELEKYGFKKDEIKCNYVMTFEKSEYESEVYSWQVHIPTRTLYFDIDDIRSEVCSINLGSYFFLILFILIKDGLVEKVQNDSC